MFNFFVQLCNKPPPQHTQTSLVRSYENIYNLFVNKCGMYFKEQKVYIFLKTYTWKMLFEIQISIKISNIYKMCTKICTKF